MLHHDDFHDPVLGQVTRDVKSKQWRFSLKLRAGQTIDGIVVVEDVHRPFGTQELSEIKRCIGWVQDNESAIRMAISNRLFDGWKSGWYDEEIDAVTTREGFREAIALTGVQFYEAHAATLIYDDGDLFGGHAIVLSVNAEGHIIDNPRIEG